MDVTRSTSGRTSMPRRRSAPRARRSPGSRDFATPGSRACGFVSRFTFRDDSLWWFAELYLHKQQVILTLFRALTALESLVERERPRALHFVRGGAIVQGLAPQVAAASNIAVSRPTRIPWLPDPQARGNGSAGIRPQRRRAGLTLPRAGSPRPLRRARRPWRSSIAPSGGRMSATAAPRPTSDPSSARSSTSSATKRWHT